MFVQVTPALVENSHRVIEPVCPAKVRLPLFAPLQTVVPPETVPPTDGGFTVIIAALEKAVLQAPL